MPKRIGACDDMEFAPVPMGIGGPVTTPYLAVGSLQKKNKKKKFF
jgi:hypothetical protein